MRLPGWLISLSHVFHTFRLPSSFYLCLSSYFLGWLISLSSVAMYSRVADFPQLCFSSYLLGWMILVSYVSNHAAIFIPRAGVANTKGGCFRHVKNNIAEGLFEAHLTIKSTIGFPVKVKNIALTRWGPPFARFMFG